MCVGSQRGGLHAVPHHPPTSHATRANEERNSGELRLVTSQSNYPETWLRITLNAMPIKRDTSQASLFVFRIRRELAVDGGTLARLWSLPTHGHNPQSSVWTSDQKRCKSNGDPADLRSSVSGPIESALQWAAQGCVAEVSGCIREGQARRPTQARVV